jgi:ribonucleoside-diphosphate reductase beta chain
MSYQAVNWNKVDNDYVLMFWNQNIQQFWVDTEIPLSSDKGSWGELSVHEQEVYKRVLGGLTLLDTLQGNVGMPRIAEQVVDLHKKSVLSFMSMMENIHAKSYSSIFSTLATTQEIDEIFAWVEDNKYLQNKARIIDKYYDVISNRSEYFGAKEVYMAMVASVFLESFLFYSGFYYPLYLAGQGKMTASGEIINLIIRDESIHGVFVGMLAQEIYNDLSQADKYSVEHETVQLLKELHVNERLYTEELYSSLDIQDDVLRFVEYNANKAMMNLGLEPYFPEQDISQIVLNGLKTDTKNHDFFSVKGNGYVKAINVEPLTDDSFVFDWLDQ